jgi:hypothetical protein
MFARRIAAGLVALLLASCAATYSEKVDNARAAVAAGDYDGAVSLVNEFIGVESRNQMPDTWEDETALAVLERGSLLQAVGQYRRSARDFMAAEKELEVLDLTADTVGTLGKYLYSDSSEVYRILPTESLALSGLNMLNFLAKGDLEKARIESRRLVTMQKYFEGKAPDRAFLGFASYLAGFTCERRGEVDSANLFYKEARVDRTSAALPAGKGEILVVAVLGRVPYKVPERMKVGLAVGLAGALITDSGKILERSATKVIVYPKLVGSTSRARGATVRVDEKPVPLESRTDVAAAIRAEYKEMKPAIIAAALSRMIARAIAYEGARAVGKKKGGSTTGAVAGSILEAVLVSLDKPDTRSWNLLPNRVLIARTQVPAGKHVLKVQVQAGFTIPHEIEVTVPDRGFVCVPIVELR